MLLLQIGQGKSSSKPSFEPVYAHFFIFSACAVVLFYVLFQGYNFFSIGKIEKVGVKLHASSSKNLTKNKTFWYFFMYYVNCKSVYGV